ncbi:MAG: AAA family ATPase [Woeseiaceae bacterium]|nr:AAA family ATPase [Woeseiaceae bacterium]
MVTRSTIDLVSSEGGRFHFSRDERDGSPVLLKTISAEFADADARDQLHREFELEMRLSHPNLIRAIDFLAAGPRPVLVLADHGGTTLRNMLDNGPLTVRRALEVSLGIASGLAELHRQDIVHRDINPASIMVGDDDIVRIVDLSQATIIPRQQVAMTAPSVLQGNLHYISPEQTGRTIRAVDYRTDLYSLGITMFEMLVGEVPLRRTDPLELVHDHLAVRPAHIRDRRADVPVIVGDLVAQLLEKDPGDRYRSAVGVVRDLQQILDALVRGLDPDSLRLQGGNISTRFQFPDTLFGRDEEINTLNTWFDRAVGGETSLVLVHGYSGVGKSSLIEELRGPVNRRRGYLASGKFDQLDQGSAYRAVIKAFDDLVRQLLTEDDDRIAKLRARLKEKLGDGAGLLVEVVPNLAALLGEMPQQQHVDPSRERNRFNRLVSVFLETIASRERPLVIVLDDLQWADTATIDFVERMTVGGLDDSLMFVAAYRDNEVNDSHPITLFRQRLADDGVSHGDIALKPLSDDAMSQFISASLGRSGADAAPLTKLCIRRTGSNPFFTRMFLSSLFEDGLLQLDPASGAWSWDMEQVAARQLTENMVELAMRKIATVSDEAQHLLSIMSIIGFESDGELLQQVCDSSPLAPLQELAAQDLVTLTEGAGIGQWQFSHDRIQEAASVRFDDDERLKWHQRIGDALNQRLQKGSTQATLFAVLRHLNLVARAKGGQDPALAQMNLDGGRSAMRATAYDAALDYFDEGVRLLGPDPWKTQTDLTFGLHIGAASSARLATRFDDLGKWLERIYASAPDIEQRMQATQVELLYLADNTGNNDEAVVVARKALAQLGWQLPEAPSTGRVIATLLRTRWLVRKYSTDELDALPVMEDATSRMTMRVLHDTVASAYWADPNLMALMIFKAVRLTVKHGNDVASGMFYAAYGMVLSAIVGKPVLGLRYADLGVGLSERFGSDATPSRVRFIRDTLVAPTTKSLREIDKSLEKAYVTGTEIGDMGFATGAFFFRGLHRLLFGTPLDDLEPFIGAAVDLLKRHSQLRNLAAALTLQQFVHDIRHGSKNDAPFTGPHVDAETHLADADRMTTCWTLTFRGMVRFHRGDSQGALTDLSAGNEYLDSTLGQALVPIHHLYACLASATTGGLRAARKSRNKLAWFAKQNPLELESALLLADGVLATKKGEFESAHQFLDSAAGKASERAVPLIAALAATQLAELCEATGDDSDATKHRLVAYEVYRNWGATALGEGDSSVTAVADGQDVNLDLETVVRASEAISEQIEFESLLKSLLEVMLQNAGADRGVLYRVEHDAIVPEAQGQLGRGASDVKVATLKAGQDTDVPDSVIRLVARTTKPVISERAMADPVLGADAVIQSREVRSLLCLPLINQGRLRGILYLENNQVDGAFTPERYRLLRVLSGQAASALEKARLLDEQRQLIAAQNKFVPEKFLRMLGHDNLFDVGLGEGMLRRADVLFTDIRGFTTIVEHLSPNEAMEFLNDYLAHMEPVVHEYGGFIDRYDGDAILALFDAADGDAAVRAAIAMAEAERGDNARRAAKGLPPVYTGFGVNTAEVMLGVVGGETSMRASLIGDGVNLAARVESLTKRYATRMLIAESTASRLRNDTRATLRPLERLQVVGKTKPTLVFEVLEAMEPAECERRLASLDEYRVAHDAYEKGEFKKARDGFAAVAKKDPEDKAVQIMLGCAEALLASGENFTLPPVTRLENK